MLFNSIEFLFFFVIVTVLYFVFPHRQRWWLLLLASCYFYMVFVPIYILILGFTIVIDYFAALFIEKSKGGRKKQWLIASIIANVGVLATFKYYNFLNDTLTDFLGTWGTQNPVPYLSILLPVGLSFHTFQAMSYTIEVYRGKFPAEKHFGIYALYVMFYPQLVAGPIERPQNILPQFRIPKVFEYTNVTQGLQLMAWGFFKKVVIADRLGVSVDHVFSHHLQLTGLPLIIAAFFWIIQIYCDFSGYSDIAIGSARVMGFKLMTNFNRPLLSKSMNELWLRWHISLSTWFRDYVYIPLGGSKDGFLMKNRNLLTIFALSGLWHGAAWRFVAWGILNGILVVIQDFWDTYIVKKDRKKPYQMPKTVGQYSLHIVRVLFNCTVFAFTLIIFRTNTIREGLLYTAHCFQNIKASTTMLVTRLNLDYFDLTIAFLSMCILFGVEIFQERYSVRVVLQRLPFGGRYLVYALLLLWIICFGKFEAQQQFVYFQF